jgi:hypothetical protein
MSLAWGVRWSSFLRSGKNLKIMWVITGFVVALYAGIIRPQERYCIRIFPADDPAVGSHHHVERSGRLENIALGGTTVVRMGWCAPERGNSSRLISALSLCFVLPCIFGGRR